MLTCSNTSTNTTITTGTIITSCVIICYTTATVIARARTAAVVSTATVMLEEHLLEKFRQFFRNNSQSQIEVQQA